MIKEDRSVIVSILLFVYAAFLSILFLYIIITKNLCTYYLPIVPLIASMVTGVIFISNNNGKYAQLQAFFSYISLILFLTMPIINLCIF